MAAGARTVGNGNHGTVMYNRVYAGQKTVCLEQRVVERLLVLTTLCLAWSASALGLDRVTLRRDGAEIRIEGRRLITAQDGGILLLARDGVLWTVQPTEIVEASSDETAFEPMTADELSKQLLGELPKGFDVHPTEHYLIFFNTSRTYARWCGALFERLYGAFTNYFSRKGFELSEPQFPLVAVVFADRRAYAGYSRPELGQTADSIIGYFSLRTNRMVMYDLMGLESSGGPRRRMGTSAQINRILAQPGAGRAVATIVHEATHQIAFNCGLHTRYSDCPLWFSEGIAVNFETPDLGDSRGWRSVEKINPVRLKHFRSYLRRRPGDSLATLVSSDQRFRDRTRSLDAYAEAWALTYFLMRAHSEQYVAYLKLLSAKGPMLWDEPDTRLAEFKQAFGDDLDKLDEEFLRYMSRVR